MITRRKILLALGAGMFAPPLATFAQQPHSRIARIGLLEAIFASSYAREREALIAGLRQLGYVEGKNMAMESRWAEGSYERLPDLAAELVRMKMDVIVAGGYQAISAVQQATASIPIVMVRTSDPVAAKFVSSLARPGRNITGLSNANVDVMGKYLELLRIAIPKLSRVAVLVNPNHPSHPGFLKRVQATEKASGVSTVAIEAGTISQIEAAFNAIARQRAEALIVLPDSFFYGQGSKIAQLAGQYRLPTMFGTRDPVEAGGLLSYGQDITEHYRRAATYIDKILRGAKPADLPVEQPTKIELVINLKTAKAIGLVIPRHLLFRADAVIE